MSEPRWHRASYAGELPACPLGYLRENQPSSMRWAYHGPAWGSASFPVYCNYAGAHICHPQFYCADKGSLDRFMDSLSSMGATK